MYAVFMDYELDGVSNTVILGGSIGSQYTASDFLENMSGGFASFTWEVDEEDLPWGYRHQTYYVSSYDPNQQMIGTH